MRLFFILTVCAFLTLSATLGSCGSSDNDSSNLNTDSIAIIDTTIHTVKVKHLGGSLRSIFNDINAVHLEAAIATGIEPITDIRSAQAVKLPLITIKTCEEYYLDTLTHSLPYLTPKASNLLKEIGKRFTDTIYARSGNKYKLKVTSVLRTEGSIEKLRRRNRNASDSSAHQYGTTFDISYAKFIQCNPNYRISQESLKNVLGEVLFDLRKDNRCFVKYEIRQGCFHITAR